MARIIENMSSERRTVQMSVDDIISTVREYQNITKIAKNYEETRFLLAKYPIFLPEEL